MAKQAAVLTRKEQIARDCETLMRIPGLCGHEGRVRRHLAAELEALGLTTSTDRLGNLIATLAGEKKCPFRDAVCPYGPAWTDGPQD